MPPTRAPTVGRRPVATTARALDTRTLTSSPARVPPRPPARRSSCRAHARADRCGASHTTERENTYAKIDPGGLARSLPGISDVGGPVLVAKLGNPARFAHAKQVRAFTGLAPKASETG